MSRFREVLREKNFLCFWLGQVVSQFGDRLNQMALIALVYDRMGGSAFGLAKVMSFTIIPSFLISPIAGAYVDRWDRKRTMIITDIVRAVLVLLIPLFFANMKSFIPVYVTVFLIFSSSCFFLPCKFSIIPDLVSKEKLMIANSLTNTTMMLAAVLGVGIGGALIESVGAEGGFYIDAMTYLVSAFLLCGVVVSMKKTNWPKPDDSREKKSVFSDIKEGMLYVAKHPYMRFVFTSIFLLMLAAGALYIIAIVFIQSVFHSITKDIGFLSVFIGAGFFIGALLCGRFGNKIAKSRIIFISLIMSGISIGLFAIALKIYPAHLLAAVLAVFIGISVGPIFISSNTLVHEVIKAEMRGRIFSSLGIVMNLGFIIGMFLASKLSEFLNPMGVILGISALLLLYGSIGLTTFKIKR